MLRKCSTLWASFFLALAAWGASPCPPALVAEAHKVGKLRRLPATWQPRCELLPEAALPDRLKAKLTSELPLPPQLFLEVLQRLGFVPPRRDLFPKLLDFYASQVLGYYEPSRDTMVVVDKPLPDESDAAGVWLHELAHAAQEKRFRLPTKLLAIKDNSDRQRTFSAIAEGEAMLVMLTLASPSPPPTESLEKAAEAIAESSKSLARAADIGDFFVEDLAFPYAQGLRTVLAAFEKGGWPAVDRLVANPPQCTAALLFASPCHHLTNDALPPVPQGFQELFTDTLGAWAMRFWLAPLAGEEAAGRLARAWDGDRLRLVRSESDPDTWALCWKLRVQRPEDAAFAEKLVAAHAPGLLRHFRRNGAPQVAVARDGRTVTLWVDWTPSRP